MKDKYLEARKYLKTTKKEDEDFWEFFNPDDFTEDELFKLNSLAEHLGFRELSYDLVDILFPMTAEDVFWEQFIAWDCLNR